MKFSKLFIAALAVIAISNCSPQPTERVKTVIAPGGGVTEEWTEALSKDGQWRKEGKYTAFYPSCRPKESGKYASDIRVGRWNFWYDFEGRHLLMRGNYAAGEMDGVWEFWMDPSHHKSIEHSSMSHGAMAIGSQSSAGADSNQHRTQPDAAEDTARQARHMKPHKRESYKAGKPDGLWLSWHSATQIADSAFYVNGKLEGRIVSYSPTGALWSTATYQAGILIGKVKIWNDAGERVK